ncbi:GGDEF domain-containing protein [Cytobacillus sp. Hz8]|uniref:GGDEF domain-containing protein n=1 Tax=Cytobacillus sp. Hz8 TaxID=3347168 RepID=UPI0035DB12FD
MNFVNNLVLDIYSILLLIIICFHSFKQTERDSIEFKLFLSIVITTILLLLLDIGSRLDGNPGEIYYVIDNSGNFLIFLLNLILPSLWLLYVHYQVFQDERKTKRLCYPLLVLNVLNAGMATLTLFNGWYYYVDSHNIYHRGPLFLLSASIIILLLLISFILVTVNRRRIDKKSYCALVFFGIPPLISIILQIVFYGISFILNSVVLSLLIAFLNIQNRNIYIDYLTGVYNRKRFELYLKGKISKSGRNKRFAAIMVDLNDFKSINDTYGHDMGDKALQISADLFSSCLKPEDFIARFGGDEFCIVLDVENRMELEGIVSKIKNSIERYNKYGSQPFNLQFSMGYTIYDDQSHMTVEEFQKQIDSLMYENKQKHKQKAREISKTHEYTNDMEK